MGNIRINKYLSDKKICSRREADRLIESGCVFVNGKKAVLGQKVSEEDNVEVKGVKKEYKYYAYYKPVGVVSHKTSPNDIEARQDAGLSNDFAPVGRLDKSSHGLMILTNDGRIVDKLLNPKYSHEKEYIVRTDKYIKEGDLKKMSKGVCIEGYTTRPAKVKRISDKEFRIVLMEGKKHQIRRMLAALGYVTESIKRVRMQNILLKGLKAGAKREIKGDELKEFLIRLGF